jgi:hypothetical protein
VISLFFKQKETKKKVATTAKKEGIKETVFIQSWPPTVCSVF